MGILLTCIAKCLRKIPVRLNPIDSKFYTVYSACGLIKIDLIVEQDGGRWCPQVLQYKKTKHVTRKIISIGNQNSVRYLLTISYFTNLKVQGVNKTFICITLSTIFKF